MTHTIHHGDCLDVLRGMPDNSVDAVVTDPPYGLSNTSPDKVADTIVAWASGDREYAPTGKGFMGASWDAFVPPPAVWDECFRVLKPGGHLVAFAGSRTQDLMGLSIRLAGLEIRENLAYLYGSGFPKSLDVSKAIGAKLLTGKSNSRGLKEANAQRPDAGPSRWADKNSGSGTTFGRGAAIAQGYKTEATVAYTGDERTTSAATDEAKRWQGWGTALKPAHEPIILARKPFPGTVAQNTLTWGAGGLNIDATRIGTQPAGRWPANVVLDEHQAHALDLQSGTTKSQTIKATAGGSFLLHGCQSIEHLRALAEAGEKTPDGRDAKATLDRFNSHGTATRGHNDEGGASRFFKVVEPDPPFMYAAKAPKRERPSYTTEDGQTVQHATVKPLSIMQWLVKLVTPEGGTVLDPFAGSGTTVEAAIREGFNVIGIEREAEYLPLIQQRIDRATDVLPLAS